MAEINDENDGAPEILELKTDDIMMNVESPAEETSNNSNNQMKMESGIIDEEETDRLVEGSIDVSSKEEGEFLNGNGDITEDVAVKTSPTVETDLPGQKKNPALVIVGSNHKFNVRSRYLGDSLGSCHDLCKYGHKHESEKKTRSPTLRTIREVKPLTRTTSVGVDLETCAIKKVTNKKELHRRLSLPGPIPEKAPITSVEDKKLPKKGINQYKMKRVQSEIKLSSVQGPGTSSRSNTDTQAVRKTVSQSSGLQKSLTQKVKEIKTWKVKGSYSKGDKELKAKESMCSFPESSLNKKVGYRKGVKEIKEQEPRSYSPKTPLKKSPSVKARLYKNRKSISSSRNQINPDEAKVEGHDDNSDETLHVIEPNADIKLVEKDSNGKTPSENVQNSPPAAQARKPQGSKGNRKGSDVSLLSFSSQESSQPQGEKKSSEAAKNKTISAKTSDSGSKPSTPRAKSTLTHRMKNLDFKNTKQIETMREDGWSKPNTPREKSTVDHRYKPKKKEKSHPEEKDASAWKVKFKRGTVVALQVANNAPKKLRFKRGRILDEDQSAKAEVDSKLKNDYDVGNESPEKPAPEKVLLRHQEASEKKDDVDLNNVIEETASKLVKTRKSKVKALVGAFETVMSLRDRKRLVESSAS